MEQYKITGMSCAACSSRVEKAVSALPNIDSCSVNLLTNFMSVEGTATEEEIINAVTKAGYGASKKGTENNKNHDADNDLVDTETPLLKRRLIYSLGFLIVLMYFSMGHTMLSLPLPSFFHENYIALGLVQLLLCIAVMIINKKFFINGFMSLFHKSPNMDTLVALGSGAAFVYSLYALFMMTSDIANAHKYTHEFYFESAAMILALITVGKMLESYSKGKTTNALKGLMDLSPKTAVILIDGVRKVVPVEDVKKGDIFIVKPGESIPVDGIVLEGESAVNEAVLTGESIPVDKGVGDEVSAATINQSGHLRCEARKVGEDTTISQIIRLVSETSSSKAPIASAADKVSGIFVPVVIVIAFITTILWLFFGEGIGFALARGISVLVISCPCALGLATPVAIMVGNGVAAKNGILFKTATSLEETGKIKIIAIDKTGTITQGMPKVTDIIPVGKIEKEELLLMAYSLESKSEHPLATAIVEKAELEKLSKKEISNFSAHPGNGLSGIMDNYFVFGGNLHFIKSHATVSEEIVKKAEELSISGKTPLFFAKENEFLGIIAVADVIKKSSPEAIRLLKKMGIKVVMLTGDNELTAKSIASQANVDEVISGVMPAGKEEVISNLQKRGKVAMVGDGINDAPALTRADVGIAIGAGTDIAIDAADVVLVKSDLSDVPAAIKLSRATLKNIHENLFWAFIYNVIGIPLAAGVWIPIFNLTLNPMFGAAAMSLSSFCVVSNALRLNFVKLKKEKKEKSKMEKTLIVEGMMCPHCEARVKGVLEELPEVSKAVVSHEKGTATVVLTKEISDDVLKMTIEKQGYKVL